VLRGLEPEKSFETAPETSEPSADATEPQAEPELTVSKIADDAFEKAEGKWVSEWETSGGGKTTAKTTFDIYGRMASIPHRFATFHSANEDGAWEGYWNTESGRHRCEAMHDESHHWGIVRFQFDATYNQFEGTWDFCGQGETWTWAGKRVARW